MGFISSDLLLNEQKTKAIVIGTRRFIAGIPFGSLPSITVGNVDIPFSIEVSCLGVTISSTLSWAPNTVKIARRINSIICQLKLCRNFLPRSLRARLVSTLVFPHIDYCCLAYLDITKEQDLILNRSLNSFVRFVLDIKQDAHISEHYHQLGGLRRESEGYISWAASYIGYLVHMSRSFCLTDWRCLLEISVKTRDGLRTGFSSLDAGPSFIDGPSLAPPLEWLAVLGAASCNYGGV